MSKSIRSINEIISLSVMLLMIMALVVSQANTTFSEEGLVSRTVAEAGVPDDDKRSLRTTVKTHIGGKVMTISIDAVAGFGKLRFVSD